MNKQNGAEAGGWCGEGGGGAAAAPLMKVLSAFCSKALGTAAMHCYGSYQRLLSSRSEVALTSKDLADFPFHRSQ